MGNRFRRGLSLVLLLSLAVILYRFFQVFARESGVMSLVLKQALGLGGLIAAVLGVAWYFRSR